MSNTPGFDFEFTEGQLQAFLGNNPNTDEWYLALCRFLPQYGIVTRLRVAAFLAQTYHESGGFRFLSENLNYRWESLRRVFPKYFPNDDIAKQYAHQPERIANRVYANRMGNRNEASGDGWRYRGQGLIQLTGFYNQNQFAEDTGIPIADVPTYLGTYEGAVQSACWFWQRNNLNQWADEGNIVKMTQIINGGTNGLDDRINQYNRALNILGGAVPVTNNLPTLRLGSRGEDVRAMQAALGITADGVFGPGTERAVRDWQAAHGLTPDGIAGPVTLSQMLGKQ